MSDATPHPESPLKNPSVRRERSDVSFRGVMVVIAAALVAGLVIHVVVYSFFQGYRHRLDVERRSSFPLSAGPEMPTPPPPRLEQVDRLSGSESPPPRDEALHRYDRGGENGFVRVPIERAMERLAGKLPARDQPDEEKSRGAGGLVEDGAPNSGRLFKKEKR